ncbi:hypothetical protein CYMTET_17410 [Cymbomonas tetramitiformis]|uniref:alpha,alpha-trehalase n=1 Tax=Cymbomonas tetramitiformis TaxID=36881 RepID=A0AAE0L7B2_9CHLO|nr:hypothetical protein CYMTET_17410 [Cymbomonas tetramitiformis]
MVARTDGLQRCHRLRGAAKSAALYLQWDLKHRSGAQNGTYLLSWKTKYESGMDNSPRFDLGVDFWAVDFSTFFAIECSYLSKIFTLLDDAASAAHWRRIGFKVTSAIHQVLWDSNAQLYMDTWSNGTVSSVRAESAFLPLLLDNLPVSRADAMVAALQDKTDFFTPTGVPSLSMKSLAFCTDMWRGPMWVNYNWLISMGLRKQLREDMVQNLLVRTVDTVKKYYDKYGVVFEFYDSEDRVDPRTLARKGSRSGGVRDYHWTAALIYHIIIDISSHELHDPHKRLYAHLYVFFVMIMPTSIANNTED